MWQNKAVTKVIKILLAESAAWQWLSVLLLDALETDAVDLLMTEAATALHIGPKVTLFKQYWSCTSGQTIRIVSR